MKKSFIYAMAVCAAMAMTSCGSNAQQANETDGVEVEQNVENAVEKAEEAATAAIEDANKTANDVAELMNNYSSLVAKYIQTAKKAIGGDKAAMEEAASLLNEATGLGEKVNAQKDQLTADQASTFSKLQSQLADQSKAVDEFQKSAKAISDGANAIKNALKK